MSATLLFSLSALSLAQADTTDLNTARAQYECGKKESKAACAKRLHAALKTELARAKPTFAVTGFGCKETPKPDACELPPDCIPLAAIIAGRLVSTEQEAAIALPALEAAEARWPAYASPIRLARAAGGAPGMLAVAEAKLGHAETECRWEGIRMLRAMKTTASLARLAAFARVGFWPDRQVATQMFEHTGASAVPAVLPLLSEEQPLDNLRSALVVLLTVGPPAAAAMERVRALAETHWSGDIRAAAALAATAIGGKKVSPRAMACAPFDGGMLRVENAREVPQPEDACTKHSRAALTVDGVCITGDGEGEWGGSLSANGKVFFTDWHAYPVRIFQLGGRTYVLQRMEHMGSRGEIVELIHTKVGWRVEFVASLPGGSNSLWLDERGEVMLHTKDGSQEHSCEAGRLVRFLPRERRVEVLW